MYVWNYYGNVPVVGVVVGFTVVVVSWLRVPWNLIHYWFGVCVQTFIVACLLPMLGNDRPVELSLCGPTPSVETAGYVTLLQPCVPMCCKHCV